MKREYPLDIENVGEDTYIVMSRGHHDPHAFMRKVREEGYDWPLGMPSHRWVKMTPANDGGEHSCFYNFVDEGTRGAFPATYAHEAYGDDRYEVVCATSGSAGGGAA
ncbi:hypothetical protein [Paraburkholderia caribensis]|uniref:hypothetical protein n=1 Tax=Paraburkholderia caribensis TaxID=75105 RepID=UPI0028630606|nr:hypothetical protein [Paraburkholderia caribensis]MDR6381780.1 hypothetical protein [Paraburkholderia caribensis]